MSLDSFINFNEKKISHLKFPPYIELHYQTFKDEWKRIDERTSRLCYLAWLLAYDHKSALLNYAKEDAQLVQLMLSPWIDLSGKQWKLTNLEIYFIENYKEEFAKWIPEPLKIENQEPYREWFLHSARFTRFIPEYKHRSFDLFEQPSPFTSLENGIDIIGFPKGVLGVGELTRSLIESALRLNLNVNVVSAHTENDDYKNIDTRFDHLITDKPRHKLRVFAMPLQNIPVIAYNLGINYFRNSYNILNTAWEFDRRTPCLDNSFILLDEVWTLSNFVKPAFNNPENIPVKVLPCALPNTNAAPKNRKKFSLPEDTFLFLCAFDFNSYMKRKNPEKVVEAFVQAFGKNDKVGLVVKCNYAKQDSPEWQSLISKIQDHKNIFVMDKTFSRSDFIELLSTVDSFVSLHRSEGFGYIIAEAMEVGTPVVCTGYSGNMDYCSDNNSYLVDYDLSEVKPGEYPQSEGLLWAEPETDSAVTQMRAVYEDEKLRNEKIVNAKNTIRSQYTYDAVSKHLESLLKLACSNAGLSYTNLKRKQL